MQLLWVLMSVSIGSTLRVFCASVYVCLQLTPKSSESELHGSHPRHSIIQWCEHTNKTSVKVAVFWACYVSHAAHVCICVKCVRAVCVRHNIRRQYAIWVSTKPICVCGESDTIVKATRKIPTTERRTQTHNYNNSSEKKITHSQTLSQTHKNIHAIHERIINGTRSLCNRPPRATFSQRVWSCSAHAIWASWTPQVCSKRNLNYTTADRVVQKKMCKTRKQEIASQQCLQLVQLCQLMIWAIVWQ